MMDRQLRAALMASACVTLSLWAQNAAAQTTTDTSTATEADSSAQDIVVIGSQIRGASVTEALPVSVVTSADIVNTGAVSGDELFRSIPQMGDVTFNSSYLPNSSNSARGDVGSVNLRSLGVGNTLVLLNGRRLVNHPTSRADDNLVPVLTQNTNSIPVSGVARMEVLRDGAAAIYGSDAVAGVINTVLRSDYNGMEVSTQFGAAEGTRLTEFTGSLLAGKDLGDRGNITIFADYAHRTALGARDQDYTRSADVRGLFADTRFADATSLDGRSTITPWGSFQTYKNVRVTRSGTALTNASGQFHIQPSTNAGCQTALAGGICVDDGTNTAAGDRNLRFDAPAAYNTDVMPSVERLNVFMMTRYDLTDDLEFFGEAGYYRATSHSVQSSTGTLSSGPIVIPASNYWNPFGATTLPNGAPNPNRLSGLSVGAAGQAITLSSYNFSDFGPNNVDVTNTQFRALGGLRFKALGFDWESALLYSEAKAVDISDGISATLLQQELARATPDAYNPFNGSDLNNVSGADMTASNAAAIDRARITTERRSRTTLALWDLKGSKADLLALPGGDLGIAFGVELRRETQSDDRDPRLDGTITFTDMVSGFVNTSDLIGSSPSPDTSGHRTVFSAFGELAVPVISPEMNIPLINRLEVQLAGRFENYSDVGSIAKPKIAAAWDVVDGVRLRGSYSQGFKAPNLEQVNATLVTRSNTRTDWVRCQADLKAGRIPNFAACSQGFATTARRSGNPDLKPEESTSWSVGLVLEPEFLAQSIGRTTFTIDYWNIRQTGIVGLFGEGNALINDYLLRMQGKSDPNVIRAEATQDDIDLFAGSGLTPAGRVLYVNDQYVNLLPQEVAGIDASLSWRSPETGIGRFNVNVNVAYLDKYFLEPSAGIQALLDARASGQINPGTTISEQGDRVRANGRPRWRWNASLTWTLDDLQIGAYTAYVGQVNDTNLLDSDGIAWVIQGQQSANLYVQYTAHMDDKKTAQFRLGVRNLTDEKPPLSSAGYLGSLYNPYGRYWYANVRVSL